MKKFKLTAIIVAICAVIALSVASCADNVSLIKINGKHKDIKVINANIETKSISDERYMLINVEYSFKKGVDKLFVDEFSLILNGSAAEFKIFDGENAEYSADGEILKRDGNAVIVIQSVSFELNDSGGYSVELSYGGEVLLKYSRLTE